MKAAEDARAEPVRGPGAAARGQQVAGAGSARPLPRAFGGTSALPLGARWCGGSHSAPPQREVGAGKPGDSAIEGTLTEKKWWLGQHTSESRDSPVGGGGAARTAPRPGARRRQHPRATPGTHGRVLWGAPPRKGCDSTNVGKAVGLRVRIRRRHSRCLSARDRLAGGSEAGAGRPSQSRSGWDSLSKERRGTRAGGVARALGAWPGRNLRLPRQREALSEGMTPS